MREPQLRARYLNRNAILFAAVVLAFLAQTAAGSVSFPLYYEDESWTYLAVFEALRGNGLTWAAFGEGRPMLGTFLAAVTPIVALPIGPEAAVRVASAAWALLALAGAFVLGRRVTSSFAWVVPALMVATPSVLIAIRYGRTDVAALALTLWAIACAAHGRPLLAGVLSGFAVSAHPMFVWVAAPCLWFARTSGIRGLIRYTVGGCLGVVPQITWVAYNWTDLQTITSRFAVTSSLGSLASGGVFSSIANEPRRYLDYVATMPVWLLVAHITAYVALPVIALRERASRWMTLALIVPAALGLAILSQGKNPYYVYSVLPFAGVATARGLDSVRGQFRTVAAAAVAIAVLTGTGHTAVETWNSRNAVTAADMTEAFTSRLPAGAVVIAPNIYAGLIKRRPDIRFFNYHALSNRPGWGLPECADMPSRIRTLVEADPRPSSRGTPPSEAHLIVLADWPLVRYLQLIYVEGSEDAARCLLASDAGPVSPVRICRDGGQPCSESVIARMRIRP